MKSCIKGHDVRCLTSGMSGQDKYCLLGLGLVTRVTHILAGGRQLCPLIALLCAHLTPTESSSPPVKTPNLFGLGGLRWGDEFDAKIVPAKPNSSAIVPCTSYPGTVLPVFKTIMPRMKDNRYPSYQVPVARFYIL